MAVVAVEDEEQEAEAVEQEGSGSPQRVRLIQQRQAPGSDEEKRDARSALPQ